MSASQKIQVRLKIWTYIIRRDSLENISHYFPNILKHHLYLRWDGFVSTSLHNNVYVKYHIFCVEMKFTATEKVLRNIWQMLGSTLFKYWLHGRKFNWNSWHSGLNIETVSSRLLHISVSLYVILSGYSGRTDFHVIFHDHIDENESRFPKDDLGEIWIW